MKKLFALILAAALALSLAACGGGESKSKDVELTADNVDEYLALSLETSNRRANTVLGVGLGSLQDITLSSFAVQGGSFNNVQITFEISLPALESIDLFTVYKSDDAYDENDEGTLAFTVRLPSNGEFSETHTISSSLSYDLDDYDVEYTITDISGTFAPSN